jgi:hypothetical protein
VYASASVAVAKARADPRLFRTPIKHLAHPGWPRPDFMDADCRQPAHSSCRGAGRYNIDRGARSTAPGFQTRPELMPMLRPSFASRAVPSRGRCGALGAHCGLSPRWRGPVIGEDRC